jgi:hypothetical protein
MKKISIALISALCLACGCSTGGDEPDPQPVNPNNTNNNNSTNATTTEKLQLDTTSASPTFSSDGGTTQISVTATSAWTADVASSRTLDWCTVSPTSGEAGTSKLTITTLPNTTYDERNATITIKSGPLTKTYSISQKQKDALLISSNKIEMSSIGGNATIEIKSNISYSFEVEESAKSWIKHTSSRALTDHSENFTISANDAPEKREGKITFSADGITEIVTIYQAADAPTIVLTNNSYNVSSDGETIKVELKSNIEYEIEMPDVDWITESTSRAYSSHTHYFAIKPNSTYDERSARITFVNKENGISELVTITQKQKDALLLTSNKIEISAEGGTAAVEIKSNTSYSFEIEESAKSWIKQKSSRALSTHQEIFEISANESKTKREGKITFKGGGITEIVSISQIGEEVIFELNNDYFYISGDGETIKVEVNTTIDYTIAPPDWITEINSETKSKSRTATTHTHYFVVQPNDNYFERESIIIFRNYEFDVRKLVTVHQNEISFIHVETNEFQLGAAESTFNVNVQASVTYQVKSSVDWISQVTSRAHTTNTLTFRATANEAKESRTGIITLSYGSINKQIKVIQDGSSTATISGIDDMIIQEW